MVQLRQHLWGKKKRSHKQRPTYLHKMGSFENKIFFGWLKRPSQPHKAQGKKAQEGGNNVIRSASPLDLR